MKQPAPRVASSYHTRQWVPQSGLQVGQGTFDGQCPIDQSGSIGDQGACVIDLFQGIKRALVKRLGPDVRYWTREVRRLSYRAVVAMMGFAAETTGQAKVNSTISPKALYRVS